MGNGLFQKMEKIQAEIDEKVLFLCPHFKVDDVEQAINDLPDFIRVDNQLFTHYHTNEYRGGEKVQIPVNIRHVPPRKEMSSVQDIIQNDPGKYQWN